jgi:phage terminase large subunit
LSNLFEITQDKIFAKGAPKEWFAVARTSRPDTPDALQGFHASNIRISDDGLSIVENHNSATKGQIMFVMDEAAGVQDIIFEVAEGALASPNSSLLMGGNPTRGTGYFAASHKQNRADYTCLHFRSSDSPLVAKGYRDGLVRKFGEGSNVVRVRADGEFPRADDDTLIGLDLVEAAISRERHSGPGEQRRLGVDPARYGDDRTVFTLRAGPNVEKVRIEAKLSVMEIAGITVNLIKQWRAQAVFVDTIGIGSGLYDRLVEMKKEIDLAGQPKIAAFVQITDVNVAQKAPVRAVQILETESQPYRLRDYLWLEMARWFREEQPSFAGLDPDTAQDLAGELASVRFSIDSSGRTVIESKDQMKRRGLRSCDLADSLACTFYSSGVLGKGAAIFEIMRRQYEAQEAKAT